MSYCVVLIVDQLSMEGLKEVNYRLEKAVLVAARVMGKGYRP